MTQCTSTSKTPRLLRDTLLVMCACTLLVGCSGNSSTAQVSGRITNAGVPVVGASVTFQPRKSSENTAGGGMGAYGRTDAEGRYQLKSIEDDSPGVSVGLSEVLISTEGSKAAGAADDVRTSSSETTPIRFRDGSVTFEVPGGGTEEADFDLAEK